MKYFVSVLAIVVLALGCEGYVYSRSESEAVAAAPSIDAPITRNESIKVDGQSRSYIIHVPQTQGDKLLPLVIALHGGNGNADKMVKSTGFTPMADNRHFVVVYPESIGYWNDGRPETEDGPDDVKFLTQLVDYLVANYPIDKQAVYVTGVSNGGMMTLRLACEASDHFSAFGPVVANFPVRMRQSCHPGRAVPILFIDGTRDPFMPPDGGEIRHSRWRGAGGSVVSIASTVQFWAQNNGCSSKTAVTDIPDEDHDGVSAQKVFYQQCKQDLEQIRIVGGGHNWPGHELPFFAKRLVGKVGMEVNASTELLNFFFQHRRAD